MTRTRELTEALIAVIGDPGMGGWIKIVRISRAMRRKDLAAAIGKSYAHVANIENGHSQPSPETLVDIANALGLKIEPGSKLPNAARAMAQQAGPEVTQ